MREERTYIKIFDNIKMRDEQKGLLCMTSPNSPSRLLVILDREYGERLRARWPGTPVWIELSPVNEAAVRALWNESRETTHLSGITGLPFQPAVSAEDRLISELDSIDLHHGSYSTEAPYTDLEVLGCRLSNRVREARAALGFAQYEENDNGFLARRTVD